MAGIKRISKEQPPKSLACTRCGSVRLFTSKFFKPRPTSWGLSLECRECTKDRAREWAKTERGRKTRAAWAEANYGKVLESQRGVNRRRTANGKQRKALADWRKRNPGKAHEYYKRGAARKAVQQRAWREANRDKLRTYTSNYRARKIKAGGQHGGDDILRIGTAQKWKCAACATGIRSAYHVDHIYPVSKGGTNDPRNIQLLCGTCNRRKADKEPERFMRELGFLL